MEKKNRYVRWLAAVMLVIVAMTAAVPAFAYPAHSDYIADNATILDEGTENTVKELSRVLLEEKNVRIAVCTVLNTENESVSEYASSVFKKWDVGHGVLILIVTEADTFYAIQSNSVAEVLTGSKLSDIINTTMEPRFAEKDYSGAVAAAANALSSFMKENLPDGIGEKKGGFPTWLSVILKIILVLAILAIAGYVLLVYLERKQAEKRRLAMEARRRRLAEEGRSYRGTPQQGYRRPNGQRPMQQRPVNQRPMPPRQATNPAMERTGQYAPAANRRNTQQRYDDNAATVQISTADIRAVRGGRDKFNSPSRQNGRRTYHDGEN